ncbi:hypothetical protein [Caloramator sp. ALD01]|uniref:hypothetical protein n=1 Tax=Caloramator sp. ALD01 TaxID=1031288 RepID=UPI000483A4EE|nr:hypothetical protein [Caloramator sp. ALD01]
MKLLNYLMWVSFLFTSIISIFTIIVSFGIVYISEFSTFIPLEISLSLSLILWGINCRYNQDVCYTKNNFYISFLLAFILLLFSILGVY